MTEPDPLDSWGPQAFPKIFSLSRNMLLLLLLLLSHFSRV